MRSQAFVWILLMLFTSCGEKQNELSRLAEELNVRCPEMVDDETRFDRVYAFNNNLEMSFTLVHMDKALMNTSEFSKALKIYLKNNVKKQFKSNKTPIDSVFLQRNNVNLHYFYFDKHKEIVADIILTPQEYR